MCNYPHQIVHLGLRFHMTCTGLFLESHQKFWLREVYQYCRMRSPKKNKHCLFITIVNIFDTGNILFTRCIQWPDCWLNPGVINFSKAVKLPFCTLSATVSTTFAISAVILSVKLFSRIWRFPLLNNVLLLLLKRVNSNPSEMQCFSVAT